MERRAKTQNSRPNLRSVPRQIRKKVKANLYKHFQALSSRVKNAAPSRVTTRFVGNFRGQKKVLESLNCIAIEIANDDGTTEIRILTIDINSKPIRS